MRSCNSSLRPGVKLYMKIAVMLVIGSALVKTYVLSQKINNKVVITNFVRIL